MGLAKQDKALIRDLKLINYPPRSWKIEPSSEESFDCDVAIIGAGMAGLTAGAALFKEGIFNIKIFDQNPAGYEGPWMNYARMKTLRSTKDLMGPALEIPHLTFHAWFEAQWGQEAWKQLGKIPNQLWMDYLNWYRQAMQLPVENHWTLIELIPKQKGFELHFQQFDQLRVVKARKVVLATGRSGFGGVIIPEFVKHLPRSAYAHTVDQIDFGALKEKRIGIIGVGASAFDAAAAALETGAKSVDLLMRRARLPNVNTFASLSYRGFTHGYYKLSDEKRWNFMCTAFGPGIPPPYEALARIQNHQNFNLRPKTSIHEIQWDGSQLIVKTNQGDYTYDFIILGTGFYIDGYQQPELRHVIDHITLWQDRLPAALVKNHPNLGRFPYLGQSFEFLPKEPGNAPYLKDLYCFNYAATLSHGLLSSDIPAISFGARRLAEGIAADFFIEDSDLYLERLKNYHEKEFDQDKYFPPKAGD
jgi:cation diffusion facilitator CzcD-associated flavoprotein CzcO